MRLLIFSACLAVASAAPSGLYASVIVPAVKAVAVPAAIPTISPGDIQAAAIDAEVQARDFAQAEIDKARERAEQATEQAQEKGVIDSTVANEQNLEAFWSAEDKKWQAVDALKTAEAQIDGAYANNANIIAKSAVSGLIPYITAVGLTTPIVNPVPPVVYTPYVGAQSYSAQTLITGQEIKSEIKENKETIPEAGVKTAEGEKPAEKAESEKVENIASTESPAVKAAENLNAKPALVAQPAFVGQPVLAAPLGLYNYDVTVPAVRHVIAQPIIKYAPTVQQLNGVWTPTFVKTTW